MFLFTFNKEGINYSVYNTQKQFLVFKNQDKFNEFQSINSLMLYFGI